MRLIKQCENCDYSVNAMGAVKIKICPNCGNKLKHTYLSDNKEIPSHKHLDIFFYGLLFLFIMVISSVLFYFGVIDQLGNDTFRIGVSRAHILHVDGPAIILGVITNSIGSCIFLFAGILIIISKDNVKKPKYTKLMLIYIGTFIFFTIITVIVNAIT